MPNVELRQLPIEVKSLVNEGIYSLYSVKNRPGVAYVLVTNAKELYPLSDAGDLVQVTIRLEDLELGAPIRFAGVESKSAVKLNVT